MEVEKMLKQYKNKFFGDSTRANEWPIYDSEMGNYPHQNKRIIIIDRNRSDLNNTNIIACDVEFCLMRENTILTNTYTNISDIEFINNTKTPNTLLFDPINFDGNGSLPCKIKVCLNIYNYYEDS